MACANRPSFSNWLSLSFISSLARLIWAFKTSSRSSACSTAVSAIKPFLFSFRFLSKVFPASFTCAFNSSSSALALFISSGPSARIFSSFAFSASRSAWNCATREIKSSCSMMAIISPARMKSPIFTKRLLTWPDIRAPIFTSAPVLRVTVPVAKTF